MNRTVVSSSNVKSLGYQGSTQTLEVEFTQGSIYEYYGVPEQLYHEFLQAASKGKFLNIYIKNRYPYSRIA